jgi:DNA-directed RNA polymerase specialized sigma24 family protein
MGITERRRAVDELRFLYGRPGSARHAATRCGLRVDELPSPERSPEETLMRRELGASVQRHLLALQSRQRAFVLAYMDGEQMQHVARAHGISKSWGSRVLRGGLAALRAAYLADEDHDS